MMAQVWAKGHRADILRRVMCFSLFWHALDIVWVAVFTVVYPRVAGLTGNAAHASARCQVPWRVADPVSASTGDVPMAAPTNR